MLISFCCDIETHLIILKSRGYFCSVEEKKLPYKVIGGKPTRIEYSADDVFSKIKQEKIKPQEISSIKIGTYEKAIEICGNYKPQSIYQAKFSLPYTVAVACFQGNVRQKAFSKKWFSDKRVWEFMKNIELNVDKKADSVFPGSREAYVTVNTVSKRSFSSRILTRVGDPDAPLSDKELESKFFELDQASA